MRRKSSITSIDWLVVSIYLCLIFIGWLTIYSVGYNEEHPSIWDLSQNYGKQLVWIIFSFILIGIIFLFDSKFFSTLSYIIYFASFIFLILVLLLGKKVAGSTSWFEIGSIKIQPAEFAKFATALAIAKFLSTLNVNISKSIKDRMISLIIIFSPSLLIILQGDTGSALVYTSLVLVLYREGWPAFQLLLLFIIMVTSVLALLYDKYILIACFFVISMLSILYVRKNKSMIPLILLSFLVSSAIVFSINYGFNNFLKPHQKARINVLFGKEADLKGAAYNVNQSKIAIGSGGFWGKGFLKGTQTKFNFVPEQHTDFIFCTIGEEHGFIGSMIVIGLFTLLLIRIVFIAERQRQKFSRIYAYCVACILFFHLAINVGMTIGLAPVIGIPFPLISYGGSSMFSFTILIFILLRLDAERKEYL